MQYDIHLLRRLRLTIGQNIHRHRSLRKLPLRKMARRVGLSESLLDYYELGKNEIRLDHLLMIACALRVDIGELLFSGKTFAKADSNSYI